MKKKQVSKLQSLQFYNNNCSASICVIYTLFGGLYAVAYTDVAQLALIILGLFMALPNIFTNDYVDHDVLWNGAKLFDANGTLLRRYRTSIDYPSIFHHLINFVEVKLFITVLA